MSTTYTDICATPRYRELCGELSRYEDGTGTLGIVVAQALMDDESVSAETVANILDEAIADAATEREN